jgi:TM2 domain-containing membrane protein YozV
LSPDKSINSPNGNPLSEDKGAAFAAKSSSNAWATNAGYQGVQNSHVKKPPRFTVAFLLSCFFGFYGLDHFYLGKPATGLLKLLTAGGFFVWWIYDAIQMGKGKATDGEGRVLEPSESDRALIRVMKWVGLVFGSFFVLMVFVSAIFGEPVAS